MSQISGEGQKTIADKLVSPAPQTTSNTARRIGIRNILELITGREKAPSPESPAKLIRFKKAIETLSWERDKRVLSLNRIFLEIDALVQVEIEYYYRIRKNRAIWSGIARSAGWGFATIGILLPLAAATMNNSTNTIPPWGYIFLTAAGSVFAGNSLLGGSTSHIRFTSSQLSLEKVMTDARIKWCSYMQSIEESTLTPEQINNGFGIISAYSEQLYVTIISETNEWGAALVAELDKFAAATAKQKDAIQARTTTKTERRAAGDPSSSNPPGKTETE